MKLLIDIGNTLCKAAFSNGEKWTYTEQAPYSHEFILSVAEKTEITGGAFVSVIKLSDKDIKLFSKLSLSGIHNFKKLPVTNQYETKETLGEDRLAAVCGAYS